MQNKGGACALKDLSGSNVTILSVINKVSVFDLLANFVK